MILNKFVRESVEDLNRVGSALDSFNPNHEAVARFLCVYYPVKHKEFMDDFLPLGFLKKYLNG